MPRYEERRIAEGRWWAESPFFFQTQHGMYANTDRWNRGRLGGTKLGMPNCWGQYTHGGPDIPIGAPHLHRTFHRNPSYNPDSSPYGGAGLNVVYYRYLGTPAGNNGGAYRFGGGRSARGVESQGDWISN